MLLAGIYVPFARAMLVLPYTEQLSYTDIFEAPLVEREVPEELDAPLVETVVDVDVVEVVVDVVVVEVVVDVVVEVVVDVVVEVVVEVVVLVLVVEVEVVESSVVVGCTTLMKLASIMPLLLM